MASTLCGRIRKRSKCMLLTRKWHCYGSLSTMATMAALIRASLARRCCRSSHVAQVRASAHASAHLVMPTGYRSVQLRNEYSEPLELSSLLVKFERSPCTCSPYVTGDNVHAEEPRQSNLVSAGSESLTDVSHPVRIINTSFPNALTHVTNSECELNDKESPNSFSDAITTSRADNCVGDTTLKGHTSDGRYIGEVIRKEAQFLLTIMKRFIFILCQCVFLSL
jgi:hypothetical protein